MPPPPILYRMMLELGVLAGGVSLLYLKTRTGVFWLLAGGLGAAVAAGFAGAAAIAPMMGWPRKMYALATLVEGTPGLLTILVALPWLVHRIKGDPVWRRRPVVESD
jgi:hypothetical protein